MKSKLLIAFLLLLTSCSSKNTSHPADLAADFEFVLDKTDANTVFVTRLDDSIMQVTFLVGSKDEGLYRPIRLNNSQYILEAMRLGRGCVVSSVDNISTQEYKNMMVNLNSSFIISCPYSEGLVGATYLGTPPLEALPLMQNLQEKIEEHRKR